MVQTASDDDGRIDNAVALASDVSLPNAEYQKTATIGIPSPARPPFRSSDIPARSSVTKGSSDLPSIFPPKPAVHTHKTFAEQSPWERSLDGRHEAAQNYSTTFSAQPEKSMPEHHNPQGRPFPHKYKDLEKGSHESPLRQPGHHATNQIPTSKVEYSHSDICSDDSDAESHSLWILVSPPSSESPS